MAKDLSGLRVGKLLVIKRVEDHLSGKKKKRISKWLVRCDCGREFEILAYSLTSSHPTHSCRRCMGVKDLSGKKFGELIVLKRDFVKCKEAKWFCKCSCGSIVSVLSRHLQNGGTKRCWACKVERQKLNGRMSSRVYYRTLHSAKKRGIHVGKNIDKKYLESLYKKQQGKCALTGMEIKFAKTTRRDMIGYTTASIDRIDSQKGYVKGNMQWVHKDVNRMKSNLKQDRFIELCCEVAEISKNHR
jgi:hypothetical protein